MVNIKLKIKEEFRFASGELKILFKSKYFYIALILYILSIFASIWAQTFLHNWIVEGNQFPILNDLVLSHVPEYEISFLYDWAAFFAGVVFILFVIIKKQYRNIPYYLLMLGIFQILRSIFIILTPFGHPRNGFPTDSYFKGFSRYELGVYPSGHVGGTFLEVLFSKGIFKWLILFLNFSIILSLIFARGHYTIDILSGIIFAYAIFSFGEKYLYKFKS